MKNRYVSFVLCSIIAGLSSDRVRADTMSFWPSQDTPIFAESNNSGGAKGFFYLGRTKGIGGTTVRRSLMQFNLANSTIGGSIPAGSTINSVTLKLERTFAAEFAGSDVLELRPVLQGWGEGTSTGTGAGGFGYAPTTNAATWNHRLYSSQLWTNPGGDIGPTSGTLTLDLGGSFTVPSQAGMVANVQNWLDNPSSNFGWALKYADEDVFGSARQFYSREAAANLRPTLTVDFTAIPEPSSCLLLSAVAMMASTYRPRCRRSENA